METIKFKHDEEWLERVLAGLCPECEDLYQRSGYKGVIVEKGNYRKCTRCSLQIYGDLKSLAYTRVHKDTDVISWKYNYSINKEESIKWSYKYLKLGKEFERYKSLIKVLRKDLPEENENEIDLDYCPECKSKDLEYDSKHDETCCKGCGLTVDGPPGYAGYQKIEYPRGYNFETKISLKDIENNFGFYYIPRNEVDIW